MGRGQREEASGHQAEQCGLYPTHNGVAGEDSGAPHACTCVRAGGERARKCVRERGVEGEGRQRGASSGVEKDG